MRNLIAKRPWLVALSAMTVALVAVAFMAATSFNGQAQAAESKVGGFTNSEAVVVSDALQPDGEYVTILDGWIQTSQWEDVVMDVSLECGVTTNTIVRDKKDTKGPERSDSKARAMAQAGVYVKVLVDGELASPYHSGLRDPGVIFCSRMQEQIALFGGILDECTDLNGDDLITILECTWTEEELQLVLETMGAHSFNFFYTDLAQGDHHIQVMARLYENAEFTDGSDASATATIGMGSVAINEVKFVKGYNP